jgi:hypothetical protein
MAPSTYQIEAAFLGLHGEAVDLLQLEVTRNSRPDLGGNFLIRGRLVGHLARLEVSR